MRIYELAEKLKETTTRILAVARKLKLRKKYAISTLSVAQEEKIRAELAKIVKKNKKEKVSTAKKQVLAAAAKQKSSSSSIKKAEKSVPPANVFIDTGPPLPSSYDEETLVIMPKDPLSIFAYWEIKQEIQGQLILRVYERAHGKDKYYFDTGIHGKINNWYIKIPHPGSEYRAELGYIKDGVFVKLLSSNVITAPRAGISDEVDEEWMIVKEDLQDIIKSSGLDKVSRSSLSRAQSSTRILTEILKGRIPGSSSLMLKKKR
ncbi:MAG: hypothetical protein COT16_01950 [Elusimicrobia bacterium CG08_land_8_20_14_0_20_44_26]|nr:MAG: hypothetical protein COT16_01950 [Elusimicrobia bacterium CG08_land_8_20_14_0_20_44_26]